MLHQRVFRSFQFVLLEIPAEVPAFSLNSRRKVLDHLSLQLHQRASLDFEVFFPNSRMLWGLCTKYISVCSGRAGAVLGRNRVPGTGCGNWFREPLLEMDPGFDGFRQVLRFQGSGSEGCVKEVSKVSVFNGFRGVRFCSRGFDGTVSGNRVPGTRGIKKVPGQGFRQLLCTSKVYSCTLKVYFCTMLLYVDSILVVLCKYVESMFLCFERIILYL